MSSKEIELNILNIELEAINERIELRRKRNLEIAMRIYELQCEQSGAVNTPDFRVSPISGCKTSAYYQSEAIPDNSEFGARERNQSLLNYQSYIN